MKKFKIVLFFTVISQIVCSQEILLTFQPADGTSIIDSIKTVDPVTSQVSITEGTEITVPDETTSVNFLKNRLLGGMVYPNPFLGETELHFTTSSEEDVTIIITNAAGQVVLSQQKRLQPGINHLHLSVKSQGMYFITIAGKEKTISYKAVNLRSGGNEDRITLKGTSPVEITEKSAKVEEGKLYHFEIYSGENITVIADSPTESKTYEVEFHECKDDDGKNYKIVQIGEQWWMAENLAYLPAVAPPDISERENPVLYVNGYDGTDTNEAKANKNYQTYGVLYNWSASLTSCPSGWHLPSDDEWTALTDFLTNNGYGYEGNGDNIAKSLAANKLWEPYSEIGSVGNNLKENNRSGFSALPGDSRTLGRFYSPGRFAYWWSSTENGWGDAYFRSIRTNYSTVTRMSLSRMHGFSVRCVKDTAP